MTATQTARQPGVYAGRPFFYVAGASDFTTGRLVRNCNPRAPDLRVQQLPPVLSDKQRTTGTCCAELYQLTLNIATGRELLLDKNLAGQSGTG